MASELKLRTADDEVLAKLDEIVSLLSEIRDSFSFVMLVDDKLSAVINYLEKSY